MNKRREWEENKKRECRIKIRKSKRDWRSVSERREEKRIEKRKVRGR